ncbi:MULTISPECIES: hypothetical protein [Chryseobacterium]|jgi:hypothetical protein|uniref:Type VI secretion system baseplate subunit TssK n=1 Tax=Chryseobacterium indoltheticum TaxID=254 RepID=A0A3G6MVN1_9FLAO|nr:MULTISPECIES: hypothetical protein [Chryseobacterium]AZA59851.1 hypothetical protein EG340_01790 [Chryseobacterium indoltheticum]MDF2832863.1 hypothetical protein [Chryseobacterium indoltheticum]MDQ8140844.1 hypothetical protein [Chryseobacterium sp. CFS15]QQQ28723.1 hypothetical protein JJL46_01550 [Chryseobacterium indoltheticum]
MIQPIKHFAINWVDGMKVSQKHLNDQDNFLIDTIRDGNSLGITNYNYGLLPLSNEFTDKTIFDVHNTATNDVQLFIKNCSAVTLAGYRLELKDRRVSVKSLAKSLNLDENQMDGEYYILISVNPFDKVPFGDIDPEEIPPRHPNSHANYHIELLPVSSLNSNHSGGNYLVVGKVDFKGNIAQVNTNFIPPCTSIQSHPVLIDYYNGYAKSIGNLQQYAFKIIQKASHKNQNTALALNVKALCNVLVNTFGDMYFQFRNIIPYQPPVFLIETFATLALRMYNSTQILVPGELEEMLNYSLEWSEIAPHTLLNQLSTVAETNYDHHNSGEPLLYISQMLRSLETIFSKLSELDYIGQRKENIIVNEQEVSSNTNPKRGWSVLD